MTEISADKDISFIFVSSIFAMIMMLCRSIHSGVLDGLQLDMSHSWTALCIPLPATAVLGNGTFVVTHSLMLQIFSGSLKIHFLKIENSIAHQSSLLSRFCNGPISRD